ncbi:hypothetical protein D030_2769B, partial [Vibrio parahaemolyticus AQ3810]
VDSDWRGTEYFFSSFC